jgi:predicted O-linked N-acetylglucosamine transferase (SPINDLY family)
MLGRLIRNALAWAGGTKSERRDKRGRPNALHQSAVGAMRDGRLLEALTMLEQADERCRGHAAHHKLLGDVLRRLGRLDEAAQHYEEAIRLDPGNADAHNNLGVVSDALGSGAKAMACFRTALAVDPGLAEAHVNLGNALHGQRQIEAAIASFREAVRVRPDYALAYNNLAMVYRDEGRFDEARQCDDRVLELRPNDGTRVKRALTLPVLSMSTEHIAEVRENLRREAAALLERGVRLQDPLEEVGQTGFWLPYHGLNDKDLQCLIARLYEQACPALGYVAPHCASVLRSPRRRVGFLSRHFFDHSVGAWFSRLIDHLAAEGPLEAVLITVGSVEDQALRSTFPSLREHLAIPFNLERAREGVARLRLDVLVYTDIGMDPLSYFLAFSRLAPVQCAMLGHPVTSGIPNVDYFISSSLMEPEGAQNHYSESLVQLDALPAYIARPALPAVTRSRSSLGLPEDRHLYVCPTMLQKLHPDFDHALAEILRRDPKGEVVLFEDSVHRHWHEMLLERLRVTTPEMLDRVRFLPWLSADDLMSVLLTADVALDTFHFGAATTTFLVLAMGTPIVTLPAAHARGRATLACYRSIGVNDCIAATPEEYVSIAIRLATDREHRTEVAARIRERSGALYDDPRLVSGMTRVLTSLEPVRKPAARQP